MILTLADSNTNDRVRSKSKDADRDGNGGRDADDEDDLYNFQGGADDDSRWDEDYVSENGDHGGYVGVAGEYEDEDMDGDQSVFPKGAQVVDRDTSVAKEPRFDDAASDRDAMDVDKAEDVASRLVIFDVDDFESEDEDVEEPEHVGKGGDRRSPGMDLREGADSWELPPDVRDWHGDEEIDGEEEPVKKVSFSQTHEKKLTIVAVVAHPG